MDSALNTFHNSSRRVFISSTLTVDVSWRLLSSVVPSVKGPDSTFFRFSFTSTKWSSTSTLRCSATRHSSSFCFKRASNKACCLESEGNDREVTHTDQCLPCCYKCHLLLPWQALISSLISFLSFLRFARLLLTSSLSFSRQSRSSM